MNHQYIIIYSPKLQEKQIKTKGTINSNIEKPQSNNLLKENNNWFPKQSALVLVIILQSASRSHPSLPNINWLCPFAIPEIKASNRRAKTKEYLSKHDVPEKKLQKVQYTLWGNGHSRSWNKKVLTRIVLVAVKEKQSLRKE